MQHLEHSTLELTSMKQLLTKLQKSTSDRLELSIGLINHFKVSNMLELGVYRGDYAKAMLQNCPSIEKYYMLDPWRNLSNWNKPANKNNQVFEEFFNETLEKTNFAETKRIILRGKTTEVIDDIADQSLDAVYIDGDHTLKGIAIDLLKVWPKIKNDGFIIGDDFISTIWQHDVQFEPSMVFPFAVYFAEAMDVKIYALPHYQFVIDKSDKNFGLIDMSSRKAYGDTSLARQLSERLNFRTQMAMNFPQLFKLYKKHIRRDS